MMSGFEMMVLDNISCNEIYIHILYVYKAIHKSYQIIKQHTKAVNKMIISSSTQQLHVIILNIFLYM